MPQPVRFAMVILKTEERYAGCVPDLGCAAAGPTIGFVQHALRKAVEDHVRRIVQGGRLVPAISTHVGYVEVPASALVPPAPIPSSAP